MHDKEKIITMSKMAIYDKRDFDRDSRAGQYFRHDFIYKRNMRMRFFLGIGCAILLLFYVIYLLAIEGADLFAMDFGAEAVRLLIFAIILMTAYSVIGTIIHTREFLISERRINAYFKLMRGLDPDAIQDEEPAPTRARRGRQRFAGRRPRVEEMLEEDDYEEHEPYTHYHRANLEYTYRSSADPEFWDDDSDDRSSRRG